MYVRMQYWRQAVHGWMLMYLSYLRNFLQSGLMHLSQYWKIELLMSWGFELMGLVASTCVKPEGLMCLHACSLHFLFFVMYYLFTMFTILRPATWLLHLGFTWFSSSLEGSQCRHACSYHAHMVFHRDSSLTDFCGLSFMSCNHSHAMLDKRGMSLHAHAWNDALHWGHIWLVHW